MTLAERCTIETARVYDLQLLTAKEVCGLLKLGRTTLWRWVKAGTFPAPRSIGPNCTGWLLSDVRGWLANAQLTMSAGFSETGRNSAEHQK